MTTVSRHVLHLPLAPTILYQLPELQLIWEGNPQSQASSHSIMFCFVFYMSFIGSNTRAQLVAFECWPARNSLKNKTRTNSF